MNHQEKSLENLSIISRLALGVSILENAIIKERIKDVLLSSIVDKLWEFVSIDNVENWPYESDELTPENILDTRTNYNELEHVSESKALKLRELYESLPKYLLHLIDEIVYIGTTHLYGAMEEKGETSLFILTKIIKIAQDNHVILPKLDNFQKSPFSERGGWGEPRSRDFFISD